MALPPVVRMRLGASATVDPNFGYAVLLALHSSALYCERHSQDYQGTDTAGQSRILTTGGKAVDNFSYVI
jgi:hypothetical protein